MTSRRDFVSISVCTAPPGRQTFIYGRRRQNTRRLARGGWRAAKSSRRASDGGTRTPCRPSCTRRPTSIRPSVLLQARSPVPFVGPLVRQPPQSQNRSSAPGAPTLLTDQVVLSVGRSIDWSVVWSTSQSLSDRRIGRE